MTLQERLRHRIERAEIRIAGLTAKRNDGRLNEHGQWSLGYWIGVVQVLEDWMDELDRKGKDNAAD